MRVVIIFAVIIFGVASSAMAHPPSKIEVKMTGAQVDITIYHDVSNPKAHYINNVVVNLNNKKVIEQKFNLQTDNYIQSVVYVMPGLVKGDRVEVEADCNKFGMLKYPVIIE